MNIKELLGEAYKEGMTIDEIDAAIADRELIDKSTLSPSVPKSTFDKTASDLKAAKTKIAELENANLSDNEKLQKALDEAQRTKDEYIAKSVKLDVEKVLVSGGLTEEDYKEVIEGIVTTDRDKSIAIANNLVSLINSQKKAAKNAVTKELRSNLNPPPKDNGNPDGEVSQDEYDKMTYSEQVAYVAQHPDTKLKT